MTEDESKVNGTENLEDELPQPTISGDESDGSTSQPESEKVSTFSKEQEAQLESIVKRVVQSTKDKRFSTLETTRSEIREMLAQIKEAGGTIPPQLEQQYQIEDAVDRVLTARGVAPVSDKSMSGAGANQKDNFNAIDAVNKYGLTTNNPDVLKAMNGRYNSVAEYELAIANIALKVAKPSTRSDTLTSAPAGGSPKKGLSEEEKSAKYDKLNTLYKTPTENRKEIEALEKELEM
jgi:hypothetical protein